MSFWDAILRVATTTWRHRRSNCCNLDFLPAGLLLLGPFLSAFYGLSRYNKTCGVGEEEGDEKRLCDKSNGSFLFWLRSFPSFLSPFATSIFSLSFYPRDSDPATGGLNFAARFCKPALVFGVFFPTFFFIGLCGLKTGEGISGLRVCPL